MNPRDRRPAANELTLYNPSVLALKAGAACALALLLTDAVGNPDRVTSTFVAALCVSPTVLRGLRRATAQLVGSVLGGAFGTLAALAGLPLVAGIPLSVAAAIYGSFRLGFPSGYAIAAFTALFVQAVPRGAPLATFGVRLEAVVVAALSAFLVNVVVSALSYRRIFERRLRQSERAVDGLLAAAVEHGAGAVQPGFAMLRALHAEVEVAVEEMRWRRDTRTAPALEAVDRRVEDLLHLLHLVYDVALVAEEEGVPHEALRPFLAWVRAPVGDAPPVPEAIAAVARRVESQRRRVPTPAGA